MRVLWQHLNYFVDIIDTQIIDPDSITPAYSIHSLLSVYRYIPDGTFPYRPIIFLQFPQSLWAYKLCVQAYICIIRLICSINLLSVLKFMMHYGDVNA